MESLLQIGLSNAVAAALLAVFVGIVTRLWRNPHFAHLLWLIVLVRLIAPPFFPIPLRIPDLFVSLPASSSSSSPADSPSANPLDESGGNGSFSMSTPSPSTAAPTGTVQTVTHAVQSNQPAVPSASAAPERSSTKLVPIASALGLVWIAGTIAYLAVVSFRVRRFGSAVRLSHRDVPMVLGDEVSEIARLIGLRHVPRLAVVDGALPPLIWSGWRPILLVPRTLIESIDPTKRRLLLLHELIHVRRHDHVIRWFAISVLALYWWNPIAWWVVRRLQNAEEECCDAAVLSYHPNEFEIYGEALLAVSEFVSLRTLPAAALSIGVERRNHLKRRMTMILDGPRWPRLSMKQLTAVICCGAAIIAVTWRNAAAQVNPANDSKPAAPVEPAAGKAPAVELDSHSSKPAIRVILDEVAIGAAKPTAKPAAKRRSFLDDTPLKPTPDDDETQKLLKERYNAALSSLKLHAEEYNIGTTALRNVLDAARIVRDAKLALVNEPESQIRVWEEYLESTTRCWREAKAKSDVGGAPGYDRADEPLAREARLDAELKLQQLRLARLDESQSSKASDDDLSLESVPPVVVNSVPKAGADDVDPKLTKITVTFSKEMKNRSWSWSMASKGSFPVLDGKPKYLADKRTCVLPVQLEPGKTYAIWVNSQKFRNFKDADGRSAVPYLLVFKTKK